MSTYSFRSLLYPVSATSEHSNIINVLYFLCWSAAIGSFNCLFWGFKLFSLDISIKAHCRIAQREGRGVARGISGKGRRGKGISARGLWLHEVQRHFVCRGPIRRPHKVTASPPAFPHPLTQNTHTHTHAYGGSKSRIQSANIPLDVSN